MKPSAFLSCVCSSWGCQCPGETAAAHSMQPPAPSLAWTPTLASAPAQAQAQAPAPVQAEKHVEAATATLCCAGSGGIPSPRPPSPPPRCSLQDLPPELLVEIFASLPVSDLPSLAQACTKFRSILHTECFWRSRCREDYGVCANFQDLQMMGISCREFYTKLLHPYRNILGLWWLNTEAGSELLKVAVDGFCITGWKYYVSRPNFQNVEVSEQWKPCFRIRLTERKSATVECMEDHRAATHLCHLKVRKDEFITECNHRKFKRFQKNLQQWVSETRDFLAQRDSGLFYYLDSPFLNYLNPGYLTFSLTYRRVYLPPSQPEDLIRPGIFKSIYDGFLLKISMLSFHGKYARATKIGGDFNIYVRNETLEIHLMHSIQLPNVETLHDSDCSALSGIVQEIQEQVVQEQQEEEDGPEDCEGHAWQSPPRPSLRESRPAALQDQPAHSFVLPQGVFTVGQNYPRTYRMCFYGVNIVHYHSSMHPKRFPGIFILFDENHFGFLCMERKSFTLHSRIQDTFQNAEAPSPQAFLEMLHNIQVRPREEQFDFLFADSTAPD